ncbi:MAG: hydrogenase maturation protease [Rhodomicrobiaceae bacterium]
MDDGPQWMVIGIGNPERGDDGAGRLAARRLREQLPPDAVIVETSGEPSALLNELAKASSAILIDACVSGSRPGAVQRFDVTAKPLPETFRDLSSHGLGVGVAIELARSLDQLPHRCILYVIEGRQFDIGRTLSPEVDVAIGDVCDRIAAEILSETF